MPSIDGIANERVSLSFLWLDTFHHIYYLDCLKINMFPKMGAHEVCMKQSAPGDSVAGG